MDQCSNIKYSFVIDKQGSTLQKGHTAMRLRLMSLACAISLLPVAPHAQLTIDMNNIKCDQYLAMSPSESRSFSAWMSGWFSHQLSKTTTDLITHEKNVANVKAWCQKCNRPEVTAYTGGLP